MLSHQVSAARGTKSSLHLQSICLQSQKRQFRSTLWSSYMDPAFEKEIQRRHHALKHQHAELLNRKLSWDRKTSVGKFDFKTFMCSAWNGAESRTRGRGVDTENLPQYALHTGSEKSSVTSGNVPLEADYDIDTITGRKLFKQQSLSSNAPKVRNVPVKVLTGYQFQFAGMHPPVINLDGPSMEPEEMRAYRKPYMHQEDKLYPQSVTHSNPWGASHEVLSMYKKSPSGSIDLDGPPMENEEMQAYKNPFKWNEPNGHSASSRTPRSALDEMVAKHHKRHRASRRDSQLSAQATKLSNATEHHGQVEASPERKVASERLDSTLKAIYATSNGLDGLPITSEELQYYSQPYMHNEPDGQPAVCVDPYELPSGDLNIYRSSSGPMLDEEAPPLTPDELKYYKKPYKHNEPDGKPMEAETIDIMEPTEEELDIYRKPSHEDVRLSSMQESYTYDEFMAASANTLASRNSDSRQTINMDDDSKLPTSRLSAFRTDETDKREDLDLLRPSDVRAASGILRNREKENEQQKLAKRTKLEAEFAAAQEREIAYVAQLAQSPSEDVKKMSGNFARDFPEESSATWVMNEESLVPNEDNWGFSKDPTGLELSYKMETGAEKSYAAGTSSSEAFSRSAGTPRIQTSLDRTTHTNNPQHVDKFGYSTEPCGLEVSFENECTSEGDPSPAVFHTSYGGLPTAATGANDFIDSASKLTLKQKNRRQSTHAVISQKQMDDLEQQLRESRYMLNQSSLDFAKYLAKQPAYEAEAARLQQTTQTVPQQPTLYKILACSFMGDVSVAETTSIVPDHSGVLTPAEVLLKLNNPSKFFPYFAPLNAEGYEIISGSGDLLVFRKVRDAALSLTTSSKADIFSNTHLNPSNEQTPLAGLANTLHTFKSNISVRREEPVFGGPKGAWEESESNGDTRQRRVPGMGKRVLIGAGWVAACSYAVGVVSEFFTTGGSSGLGTTGL